MRFIKVANFDYSDNGEMLGADVTYLHEDGTLELEAVEGEENLRQLTIDIFKQQNSIEDKE